MLRTFATQGALALERATLAHSETKARILEESDRLKICPAFIGLARATYTPGNDQSLCYQLAGQDVDWEIRGAPGFA